MEPFGVHTKPKTNLIGLIRKKWDTHVPLTAIVVLVCADLEENLNPQNVSGDAVQSLVWMLDGHMIVNTPLQVKIKQCIQNVYGVAANLMVQTEVGHTTVNMLIQVREDALILLVYGDVAIPMVRTEVGRIIVHTQSIKKETICGANQ